jgi:hypothetical protein
MKPTVVLLADQATIVELASRLRGLGDYVERDFFDTLRVGGCELGVDASDDVLAEYEPEEIEPLVARFGELGSLLLEYASDRCLRSVIAKATRGLSGVVDDNFGAFHEFSEFGAGASG